MFPDLVTLLALAFIGSIMGLVGGITFLYVKPWSQWLAKYSTPFAAGVLLTVSLVGVLPEAVAAIGDTAFFLTLAAFMGAFLFEALFCDIHHHDNCEHHKNIPVHLVILGDTIHNFIDGAAIAAALLTAPGLGWITAVSTFLHEVPHEIGDFGILLKAGWAKGPIILVNVLSAIVTILGALLVFYLVKDTTIIQSLLAISAGIFLYLGASDFLPRIHDEAEDKFRSLSALGLGIGVMLATISFIGRG